MFKLKITYSLDRIVFDTSDKYKTEDGIIVFADCGTSTTQEILSTYHKYGIKCPLYIKGTFAFCLFDESKQLFLFARDRLGEKSLYFSESANGYYFASELHDILSEIHYPSINPLQLAQPIRYNYPIDLRQTWIDQIKRIKPGEYAIVDRDGIRFQTYWKRNHTPSFNGTKDEALHQALELVRKSVKRCIESIDGPVAVLLSGGIDSCSLAALTQEFNKEIHVISAGYKGNKYTACDERPIARRFAEDRGFIYHEVELDEKDFSSIIDILSNELDEPCFDISSIAQYALYNKASKMGFKGIISGLGGDELFFSYAYHHKIVEALRLRKEFHDLIPIKKHLNSYLKFLRKNYRFLLLPNHPVPLNNSMLVPWTYQDYVAFAKDAKINLPNSQFNFSDVDVNVYFNETTGILEMYDFMMSTFASMMCVYLGNKLTKANNINIRIPLIDSELVEFMDSLPLDMKYDINRPKMFQKEMMKGILPDYILNARKRGFEPPIEFFKSISSKYNYNSIKSSHCFFNTMMADKIITNLLNS